MAEAWVQAVLDFWFRLEPKQWWTADPDLDEQIRERFLELWQSESGRLPADFLHSPEEALAAIVLFDQFPRNMFRGHADQFATDGLALAIAKAAVDRGFDEQIAPERRGFVYMPFEHSENPDDQLRSVALFTALGDPELLRYAKLHQEIIERFGRFPHRNAILGRAPRRAEIEAGEVVPW